MSIFDVFKKLESERPAPAPVSFIVAGLGNPGAKYNFTRHNTGFLALDYLAQKLSFKLTDSRFQSLCTDFTLNGKRILFMKPQTFMNASGNALREASAFYKIPPESCIIICDDVTLSPGSMRIRKGGSAGGHNGLKSIIEQLGSEAFPRVRLGVGEKPTGRDMADWVLSRFSDDEQKLMFERFCDCESVIKLITEGNFDKAMCDYNRKAPERKEPS